MSTPTNPQHEHPSTYFVQDRSNEEELRRLQIQDQMVTTSMGGVLPEQPHPEQLRRVLDVACGTGSWLIETAKAYSNISLLIGVDVSTRMLDYARVQAKVQQVDDRVEFHMMDALRMLEFPNSFFDLVNMRLGGSFLRTWDWPKLLQEFQRVTCSGGIVRITEGDWSYESSSAALMRLFELMAQAFHQSGHSFAPTRDSLTSELAPLLRRHGFRQVQTRIYEEGYHAGSLEMQYFSENMRLAFRTMVPFLRKWTTLPDDYEEIYQQAMHDIQQPDFVGKGRMITVWGMN